MRRNTVRSLSHVRDFVASAFFAEKKDGAVRQEAEDSLFLSLSFSLSHSSSLSRKMPEACKILYICRRWLDGVTRPVTRDTCADQRMHAIRMCCCLNATESRYKYVCICGTARISARDKEISTSDYNPLSVVWDSVSATRVGARDETGPLTCTWVPRWIIHMIWTDDDMFTFRITLIIKTIAGCDP